MVHTYFKSFYARKEKEFTYNFTLFNIPTLFYWQFKPKCVVSKKRNKFHYDPSFLKYEDYFWTITIYLPYTICRTIIDLVLFIIVDELQNIKKHQDQKIL